MVTMAAAKNLRKQGYLQRQCLDCIIIQNVEYRDTLSIFLLEASLMLEPRFAHDFSLLASVLGEIHLPVCVCGLHID